LLTIRRRYEASDASDVEEEEESSEEEQDGKDAAEGSFLQSNMGLTTKLMRFV
jgi:hypothetical protein